MTNTEKDVEHEAAKQAELERTTRLRGFRYGVHDFQAEVALEALKKRNDRVEREYTHQENSLMDRKTKEMVVLAANVAQGDLVSHLQIHLHAAHKAGASPEELLEMLWFLQPWMNLPNHTIGLEAWRIMFRPDIPTIDRVVELR